MGRTAACYLVDEFQDANIAQIELGRIYLESCGSPRDRGFVPTLASPGRR
jgi:superfamily I DNA/RNA helicase